ncbi:MAG: PqqD family protein [Pseudomonadota bacterium]
MRKLADEAVILHLGTGNYFSLDVLGTRVWQLLEAGSNRSEILAALLDEYAVTPDVLTQDIDAFFQTLLDNGLAETA